jgi:acetyl-CoA acetyltransferase
VTPTTVAIIGVGQSEVGRRLGRDPLDLTVDACLAAVADAGLTPADVDGVSTWPGRYGPTPGFSPVGVDDVQAALKLELDWFAGGPEAPGQLGAIVNAYAAGKAGLARNVLCFRTVAEGTAQARTGKRGSVGTGGGRVPPGSFHWYAPFGATSPAVWAALLAARHMHVYGTTREQVGAIALMGRAHAALNPNAVYREPLSLEEYLAARTIAEPLGLYDCDVPCDGSTAVVVSASNEGVAIASIGSARHRPAGWFVDDDRAPMAASDAARMMWARTDLTPADVDVVQLYDGFSILALLWLEALGFCEPGDGGAFVEGGKRIGLDGDLPMNTSGGQLSGGRLHGFGLLHEAVVQLRGQGGQRQVAGAEVAVVAAGGGPLAGCLLLTGQR